MLILYHYRNIWSAHFYNRGQLKSYILTNASKKRLIRHFDGNYWIEEIS
jgi:hypothetical protein